MISEPELVGEEQPFGAPETAGRGIMRAEVPSDSGAGDHPSPKRRYRAWPWAIGGALVASALWAGGLYAYAQQEVDLGGYRASEDLCADAELKGLAKGVGKREGPGDAWRRDHGSVHRATCFVSLKPIDYEPETDEEGNEVWSLPGVEITYTLHKKTDPGPEFEGMVRARPTEVFASEAVITSVDGVGEQAFVIVEEDLSRITVEALNGQAVVGITTSVEWDEGGDGPARDLKELEPLLMEDVTALLAALRTAPETD
ncbi:hypothetical protein J7E88_07145 [Streptomyces sp. ISL-10]|uniref:hypothetical protein n=1 Tax=Streptomyces sp. ISL-10 TaxID=2819172 RepID=UPI001BE5D184|nr:hypothetical protein [Streptomyces sp. ISL-10]MBT2365100.1 hypothetical protein [Streptomyces sp. ISL-10]